MSSRIQSILGGNGVFDWDSMELREYNRKYLSRADTAYLQGLHAKVKSRQGVSEERKLFESGVGGPQHRELNKSLDRVWAKVTEESLRTFAQQRGVV